jgi:sucrose-6-phosphate hydrolase SacC (GH32 family)
MPLTDPVPAAAPQTAAAAQADTGLRDGTDPPDAGNIRPRLHFTPERGWLNDPHGIIWAGGEYHLFYQHVPTGTEWAAAVHWGHAVAPDLLRWRRLPIALSPGPDEEGCWTGAT